MDDFQTIYKRYVDDIYRFSLFLCGNAADAEDITSETFARALTSRAPLVSATVKGYLLTIARNLHLEGVRRRKRFGSMPGDVPDRSSDAAEAAGQKEELDAVRAFLQTFPETDRSALLLRADGLGYDEITQMLNISHASAKVKVHRLRLKLAEWRTNREQE